MESTRSQIKRRSSFFKRDLEPEDESMSTTASGSTITNQSVNPVDKDLLEEQYIKELKAEQSAWKGESDQAKMEYLKLKKDAKNPVVKTSKSDLYAMLSEKEKQEYAILFEDTDYSPVLQSIDKLKKQLTLLSVQCEHNADLAKQCAQQNVVQTQAMFEKLMNQISEDNCSAKDELEYSNDGDSIDDCLENSENE